MITILVATAENNVIGNDNQLIWHLPEDLKRFKTMTTHHPIIMGRKTYDSIGKPLPNRTNIVITQNKNLTIEGVHVVFSLEEAVSFAKKIDSTIFIIGGGNIYVQALPLADCIEMTEVHHNFEGDTFFPQLSAQEWTETKRMFHPKDIKNKYDYSFVKYEKI